MIPADLLTTDAARAAFVMVSGLASLQLVRRTSLEPLPRGSLDFAVVLAAAVTAWLVGPVALAAPAVVLLPLVVVGPAAAAVDAHEGRLPDPLTLTLVLGTLVATSVTRADPVAAVAAATAGGGVALLLKTWSGAAIGWGDVKLAPTLGMVLAHFDAVAAGLRNIALLVLGTAVLLTIGRRWRGDGLVPYGPALVLGTLGAAVGR